MNKIFSFFIFAIFTHIVQAQNVGIGTQTPTLAKLEVVGVADIGDAGYTVGAFGTDGAGISVQRHYPGIGFNQYRVSTFAGGSKYMSNGYASEMYLDYSSGVFKWNMFPSGLKDASTGIGKSALNILTNGNIGIRGDASPTIGLWLHQQPENIDGTAVFSQTDVAGNELPASIFHHSAAENTYIRTAYLDRDIVFGNNANSKNILANNTRIGNGGSTNPQTSLELFGALAITKSIEFDFCSGNTFNPGNSSRVFIVIPNVGDCGDNNPTLLLGNGVTEGQILLIHAKTNPNLSFKLNETTNIDLTGNLTMNNDDILMLIWRVVDSTTSRWTQISFHDN